MSILPEAEEETADAPSPPDLPRGGSVFDPLRHSVFRWLWIASLVSNIGTWMQIVGAAWLMTELSASALMIASVQAASSLPIFLLAVPGGALADVVDRRRLLLAAQAWMSLMAALLATVTHLGHVTPGWLLTITALLSAGAALNEPAWQAIAPELVGHEELPAAIALNGVSINLARTVGPAVGGLMVAAVGPAAAFFFNALSFLGVLFVLARWRRPRETSALPSERMIGAMRMGLRYVRHTPHFQAILVRAAAFASGAIGILALLPVLVKQDASRGPTTYGILLGFFGVGAVLAAWLLPRLTQRLGSNGVVTLGTLLQAAVILAMAWAPHAVLWYGLLFVGGAAWLAVITQLNTAAQLSLPRWVRARALAVYLVVFFGAMSGGSALWGLVAARVGVTWALTVCAAALTLGCLATAHIRLPAIAASALEPSRHWPELVFEPGVELERGPVLITIRYEIDPREIDAFRQAIEPLRLARLRSGAFRWDLFQDAAAPGCLLEVFLAESLVEHMRHHQRVSAVDRQIQEGVNAFHRGPQPPAVTHFVAMGR